jgi:hypothetical protein
MCTYIRGRTPLWEALVAKDVGNAWQVINGSEDKRIVDERPPCNPSCSDISRLPICNETPLCFAARTGDFYMVEMLLQNGADVLPYPCPKTPLITAIFAGDLSIVKLLLGYRETDEQLKARYYDEDTETSGNTPLHCAILATNVTGMRRLLIVHELLQTYYSTAMSAFHAYVAGEVNDSGETAEDLADERGLYDVELLLSSFNPPAASKWHEPDNEQTRLYYLHHEREDRNHHGTLESHAVHLISLIYAYLPEFIRQRFSMEYFSQEIHENAGPGWKSLSTDVKEGAKEELLLQRSVGGPRPPLALINILLGIIDFLGGSDRKFKDFMRLKRIVRTWLWENGCNTDAVLVW